MMSHDDAVALYTDSLLRGELGTLAVPCVFCAQCCASEHGGDAYYCEWCGGTWARVDRLPLDCGDGSCGGCVECIADEDASADPADNIAPPPVPVATADQELHTLYRFYDATDALLYVGITKNPWARLKQHAHGKTWWREVTRSTMEHYPSREALRKAEWQAITSESPKYNIVGIPKGDVTQHV